MTSNIHSIFPVFIYEKILPVNNSTLLETVTDLVEKNPQGWGYKWAQISNIWISYPITDNILDTKDFHTIKSEIIQCFTEYLAESNMLYDNSDITMQFNLSWINIHKYGQGQEYHTHIGNKNTQFSGVYYLNVSDKTGDIQFRHPYYTLLTTWASTDLHMDCYTTIKPVNGKVIIFPCWLEHMVDKNLDDHMDRISISFNIGVSRINESI